MNLYLFKTFRTSYYFPVINKKDEFLYGLYTPFGNMLSKLYWWTFRNLYFVRSFNRVDINRLNFPYKQIADLCPKGSMMSFNMGTPGDEQKISILGVEPNGTHFFAKYAQKEKARELLMNEIYVLNSLRELNITPKLLETVEHEEFVFFRTSCIEGKNPTDKSLNQNVWRLLRMLEEYHLPSNRDFCGLKTCLSHGDFTPWNMLIERDKYRLIDWEMAEERPLGYDIFTYTLHQEMLIYHLSPTEIVKSHTEDYIRYFAEWNITDYTPYLQWYAKDLSEKYTDLKELL